MISNTEYSTRDYFLLFSCALSILWCFVPYDGAERVPMLFLTFSIVLLAKDLNNRINGEIVLYFSLSLYIFINALLKDSVAHFDKSGVYLIFCHIFKAPMVMFLMTTLFRKNFDKTLKYITYILVLFACLALIFGSEEKEYDGRYSGGVVGINELGLYMTCCISCLILQFFRKQITLLKTIFLGIIPGTLLILTASKTAMLMFVIFISAIPLLYLNRKNYKESLTAIIILLFMLIVFYFILDYTKMGERLKMMTSVVEKHKNLETGTILDYFGDRGAQYYFSWPYFLENKWTGIGCLNWKNLNPTGHIVHSDYMFIYLENGIIAFCLYVIYFAKLFKRVSKKYFTYQYDTIQNRTRILLKAFLISALAGALATRIYSQQEIFIFYAMILTLPHSRHHPHL